jgi:Mn-dependent DtxR family transcriptional regulator
MDRLHEKGFIHDPKSKARSVILTEEGESATRELFERHFGR